MEDIAAHKPAKEPFTVNDVKEIDAKGPWNTKSGGELRVLFALPKDIVATLTAYDESELKLLSQDIRGLRSYAVRNIPKGAIGGIEIHRVRHEMLFVTEGVFDVECEDVHGKKKTVRIDQNKGVWIPPFVLHTYKAVEPGSLLVVCNTLFDPNDPKTQDSYGLEGFKKLQAQYKK